jgi:transcriptional regulator with XRE-family HTH domain
MTKEQQEKVVGAYLDVLVSNSGLTQTALAKQVGFKRPNIISMILRGQARLPFDKIPAMARSLGVDPAHMGRVVISGYEPDLWDLFENVFFRERNSVTENEMHIVRAIREANDSDPAINDLDTRKLKDLFARA